MGAKSATVVVETGSDFAANKGDEAYFAAMVELFAEMLPDVQIVKFDGRPKMIRQRYGVRAIYSGGRLGRRLRALGPSLRAIASADLYCWGGGQILIDEHGFVSVPYRLSRPLLARCLRRPVMSYAVGVGPLTGRLARWLAGAVLKRFDLVTVRDRASVEILRDCGLDGRIVQTVDAAVALRSAGAERAKAILEAEGVPSGRPLLAFLPWGPAYKRKKSLVPVIFRRGQAARDPEGQRRYEEHCAAVARALDRLIERAGAYVVFVPPDPTAAHGGDAAMAADIASALDRPGDSRVLGGDYSPRELKAILGATELAVGSRMHGLILAAGEGVPQVGICFSEKIRCWGEIVGQQRFFIDESEVADGDTLERLLGQAWAEREELRRQVSARRDQLCPEVRANVERLARLLRTQRA